MENIRHLHPHFNDCWVVCIFSYCFFFLAFIIFLHESVILNLKCIHFRMFTAVILFKFVCSVIFFFFFLSLTCLRWSTCILSEAESCYPPKLGSFHGLIYVYIHAHMYVHRKSNGSYKREYKHKWYFFIGVAKLEIDI